MTGKKTSYIHNKPIVNEAFGDDDGFIGTSKILLNGDGIVSAGNARDAFGMLVAYFERHPNLCTNNTKNSLKIVGDAINQVIVRSSKKINTNNPKASDFNIEMETPEEAESNLKTIAGITAVAESKPLQKAKLRRIRRTAVKRALANGASRETAKKWGDYAVAQYKQTAKQAAKKQASKAAMKTAGKSFGKSAAKFVGKGVAKLFCGPIGWAWFALDVVVAALQVLDSYDNAKNPLRPVYTAMDSLRKFFSSHQNVNTPAVKQALSVINSSIKGVRKPNEWTSQEKVNAKQNMQKKPTQTWNDLYKQTTGKDWAASPKQATPVAKQTAPKTMYTRDGTQNGQNIRNNNNINNVRMNNTNERVFYLTEGEIKRIVSESTVAVLNEGLWSGIGKGLRKVFRSGEGKKMLSKGKKWVDDTVRRVKSRPKKAKAGAPKQPVKPMQQSKPQPQLTQHTPTPQLQKLSAQDIANINSVPESKVLASPQEVRAAFQKLPQQEGRVISDAYENAYQNREIWNQQIPNGGGLTFGVFIRKVAYIAKNIGKFVWNHYILTSIAIVAGYFAYQVREFRKRKEDDLKAGVPEEEAGRRDRKPQYHYIDTTSTEWKQYKVEREQKRKEWLEAHPGQEKVMPAYLR